MNYAACEKECVAVPMGENVQSDNILMLVKETVALSCDLRSFAYRIDSFLFGAQPMNDDKRKEQECLKDELETVKSNLLETARELNDLCVKLGM